MNLLQIGTESSKTTLHSSAGTSAPYMGATWMPAVINQDGRVESQVVVVLESATPATIATAMTALARLIEEARRHSWGFGGDPVYLWAQVDASEDTYRSKVLGGWIEAIDQNPLGGGGPDGMGGDPPRFDRQSGSVGLLLHVEREPYWEGSEAWLPIYNTSGSSNSTTAIPVFNCNDGETTSGSSRYNYVTVSGSGVAGDLKAPVKLHVQNAEANAVDTVYASMNVNSHPLTFVHQKEIEHGQLAYGVDSGSCLAISTSGSTSGSASSANSYERVMWTTATESDLVDVPLPDMHECGGNLFHVMLKIQTLFTYTDLWVKWKHIYGLSPYKVLSETPWVLLTPGSLLYDTGILRLPAQPLDSAANTNLVLFAKKTSASQYTLDLDFFQLLPVDGWRVYKPVSSGLTIANTYEVFDNPVDGKLYVQDTSSANGLPSYLGLGTPFYVHPGHDHRFYFLHTDSIGAPVDRTVKVKMSYRPRKWIP